MKRNHFRFLTLLLCMVTMLCLLPMAAAAEDMSGQTILATDNTFTCVDSPAFDYDAGTVDASLGKPTSLKWNTARDWSTWPDSLGIMCSEPYSKKQESCDSCFLSD